MITISCQWGESQGNEDPSYTFPDDWLGQWTGDLSIYNKDGESIKLKMELGLDPVKEDSLYSWVLKYITENNVDEREYFLKKGSEQRNHWIIDEDNGILLDGYVLNNAYYVLFNVANNRIQTSYTISNENLIFENLVSRVEKIDSSGGEMLDSIAIPSVHSYLVTGLQRARLSKIGSE